MQGKTNDDIRELRDKLAESLATERRLQIEVDDVRGDITRQGVNFAEIVDDCAKEKTRADDAESRVRQLRREIRTKQRDGDDPKEVEDLEVQLEQALIARNAAQSVVSDWNKLTQGVLRPFGGDADACCSLCCITY